MPNLSDRKNPWDLLKKMIHVIMGLIYILIGASVIYRKWFITELNTLVSYSLGLLLILYGLFRIYRILKDS